jgi:hypothetical protein
MKGVFSIAVCLAAVAIALRAQAPPLNAADAMYAAIRADDIATLTALIKSGTDVDTRY